MIPLITVVTVTYNDLEGFRRTADSIMPQLSPAVEWLIKDGGSDSHTLQQIKSLVTGIDCTLLSSCDNGVYNAMNQSLSIAKGAWIMFMNGGDKFASDDVLSRIVRVVSGVSSADVSGFILGGGTKLIAENGQSWLSPARSMAQCQGVNCYRMPAFHQSQLYSRSIYFEQGFREELAVSADHAYFWEAIDKGALFVPLDFFVSCFYLGGLSTKKRLRSCMDVGYSIFNIQRQVGLIGLLAFVKRLLASYLPVFRHWCFGSRRVSI